MSTLRRVAARVLPARLRKRLKDALERELQVPSVEWSLGNLRQLGFQPVGVVDVGAYRGEWTAMAQAAFPNARFLMLEAQEQQRGELERVSRRLGARVSFQIALLGPENRDEVVLHQYDHAATAASVLPDHRCSHSQSSVCRMTTLDQILTESGFPKPDLLKLDVQGYELEVLKGAPRALAHAGVVLMEVSLIALYQNNPLLHEVTAFMHEHGFLAYDIGSLVRRPLDQALCQLDLIFVKADSPLRARTEWI